MKLKDFSFLDEGANDELEDLLTRVNDTARPYARDKSISQLFVEQAAATPEATAVVFKDQSLTYAELDQQSNRLARFLTGTGIMQAESFVGMLMDRSLDAIVTMVAILKAGGAYVPISPDMPYNRLRFMLQDTKMAILIGEKRAIRTLNKLQWDCPALKVVACIDSDDFYGEIETEGGMMDPKLWDHIAETAVDDISGGGWVDSYSGDLMSREVLDEYGENIRKKLEPLLTPESRVLEIGCASGISMFRLAPLAGTYVGTDLSAGILEWSAAEAQKKGIDNLSLHPLAAHEIDQLPEGDFDVAFINSVVDAFPGHNYFRQVLGHMIDKMSDTGWIFLGSLWDLELKADFEASLQAYKQANPEATTRLEREKELYMSRELLEDLRHEFPAIAEVTTSKMIAEHESELSLYRFDALLKIDKKDTAVPNDTAKTKQQFDRRAWVTADSGPVPEKNRADSLAYLIFTSGSTGEPRGVMIEHRGVTRLVKNTDFAELNEETCMLQAGALTFDASTLEIWGPLLNGGKVGLIPQWAVLDPTRLGEIIQEYGVNTLFLTTSLFNQAAETNLSIFVGLKELMTGGEKGSLYHFNLVREAYPNLKLSNVYGPTENTVYTTQWPIDSSQEIVQLPIGQPIANTTVHILDEDLSPVPIGTPGELCCGGDGVARGYWGHEELTARRFPTLDSGERIYRSGDQVRWLENGDIEFIGRIDNQVKIRGFRIEPEETNFHIMSHEAVRQAVVVVNEEKGEKQLVGYYTTAGVALNDKDLRAYLEAILPDYMIPAFLIEMDQMPINKNGKIDRRALPDPADVIMAGEEEEAEKSETERILSEIWEQTLGRTGIGVDDHFFNVGGHSLKVTQLIFQIERKLGITLPLAAVFDHPTIRTQADLILDQAKLGYAIADEPMILLNGVETGRPMFVLPPGTGDALGYVQWGDLVTDRPFYAFNFIESQDRVSRYADLIQGVTSEAVQLIGYSSGGNLAYHVTRELESRGHTVSEVIMVDSSRRLAPYMASEAEMSNAIEAFLGHESIQPYLASPVLREKQERLIRRSFTWIGQTVDAHTVAADIHVLLAEQEVLTYTDDNGVLVASTPAWEEVTSGRFVTHVAHGTHNEMLYPPHLAPNHDIIKQILDS